MIEQLLGGDQQRGILPEAAGKLGAPPAMAGPPVIYEAAFRFRGPGG